MHGRGVFMKINGPRKEGVWEHGKFTEDQIENQ